MDEGADAEGQEGNGKNGGGGLGVDGGGACGGAVEGGGEFGEGAGGAKEGKESHEEGGVHEVFAEVFLLAEESENQQDDAKVGGDESGFVDGAGEEESGKAEGDVEKGEDESDFGHAIFCRRNCRK